MKTTLLLTLVAFCSAFAVSAFAADDTKKVIYHVVSFKFKADAKPEQIQACVDAFKELKNKIPQIQSLTWGTNISPEKKDHGYTHTWVLTFASEQDRDAYLVHPDHKAFGKNFVRPVIDDVYVFDFVAQ